MTSRTNIGRFVKKKNTSDKITKALASMSDAKKQRIKKTLRETTQCGIPDASSIVKLGELAKNLNLQSFKPRAQIYLCVHPLA